MVLDITMAIEVLQAYANNTLDVDADLITALDTAIVDAYNRLMEMASDSTEEVDDVYTDR